MKALQLNISKSIVWTIVVIAACVAVVVLFMVNKQEKSNTTLSNNNYSKTVSFEVDHKTFNTAAELRKESNVVVLGSVLDNGSTKEEPSVGTSGDGQPAPGLVNTDFSVRVDKSLKGNAAKGATITVVLTGGIANDTKYTSEGMPWLSKGDSVIMYLSKGEDGKYYPLAGGAAIASKKADRSNMFTLPSEVSGKDQINISESEF